MIISSPVEKEIFFTLCERVNLVFSVCSNKRETNSFPLIEEKAGISLISFVDKAY